MSSCLHIILAKYVFCNAAEQPKTSNQSFVTIYLSICLNISKDQIIAIETAIFGKIIAIKLPTVSE